MSMDTKTAGLRFTELPLGNREFRRFVTGLGLIYVAVILALFAKLLVFPGARGSVAQTTPAIAGATSFASDIAAVHAGFSVGGDFSAGAGYVEFEPAPAEPHGTVGQSHTFTANQTHESGKPADAQHSHVARTQAFSFVGE